MGSYEYVILYCANSIVKFQSKSKFESIWQGHSQSIYSPETKLIHGNSKVPRLVITAIKIPVIHGHKINITEYEAVIALIIS